MRVRDHIALSTAGAAMLTPWLGRGALGLWAGGVLIDVDHYVWFCLRERRLNPVAAVRFFNEAHAPQHAATRRLHSPLALLVVLLLGLRRPRLLAGGAGHGPARRARPIPRGAHGPGASGGAGAGWLHLPGVRRRGPEVGTHLRSQPRLLPSYEPENLVSLCGPCHDAAHADGSSPWS